MAKKATMTYEVEATREGRWWVFTVEALGIAGQVRQLDEAEEIARSLVAAFLDVEEATVSVRVSPRLPEGASRMLAEAAEEEERARTALAAAGSKRRKAIATLRAGGMTQREVARALGLSPQRVNQLVKEG